VAVRELILGGQKSGKSRCAERRASAWLSQDSHSAVLLATALAGDEEMSQRIAQHRLDRAERVPGLRTEEVPIDLPAALRQLSSPRTLVVVDCLTLWLTNLFMPLEGHVPCSHAEWNALQHDFSLALSQAQGPVVLVSNEIGLGLSPMSPEARRFVDVLGLLHQSVAAACSRVTWMVAGCEVVVKGEAAR
jgi:adenosylcobinamide kinase/adenosylcobinamide-phosphate guanylyltransferase